MVIGSWSFVLGPRLLVLDSWSLALGALRSVASMPRAALAVRWQTCESTQSAKKTPCTIHGRKYRSVLRRLYCVQLLLWLYYVTRKSFNPWAKVRTDYSVSDRRLRSQRARRGISVYLLTDLFIVYLATLRYLSTDSSLFL